MFSYDYIEKKDIKEHNSNWPKKVLAAHREYP